MISLFISFVSSWQIGKTTYRKEIVEIDGIKFHCNLGSDKTLAIGNGQYEALDIPEKKTVLEIPLTVKHNKVTYTIVNISDYAFSKSPFVSIKLPKSISTLGKHAFEQSSNLEIINITQAHISVLSAYCFSKCASLKCLIIGSGLKSIDEHCFDGTLINAINTSIGFTALKDFAFANSQIEVVDMHLSMVSKFGKSAFENCSVLSVISLPTSLVEIPERAFANTAIAEISIPKTVTVIGESAFSGCKKLKKICFKGCTIEIFPKNIFLNCESLVEIVLPESLEEIEDFAISHTKIKEFVAPSTLKKVATGFLSLNKKLATVDLSAMELEAIPDMCFAGCLSLTNFKPPKGFKTVGKESFVGCSFSHFPFDAVTSISAGSFANCTHLVDADLSHLHLPNIPEKLFMGCTMFEAVKLPTGSLVIGPYAFSKTAIKEINLNEHVESIGEGAFAECTSLVKVDLSSIQMKELPAKLLYHVGDVVVKFPQHPITLGNYFFAKSSIRKLTLDKSVAGLGKGCFANCTSLVSLDMSQSSVLIIEPETFVNTAGLEIRLPSGLIKISEKAFVGSQLTSIKMGDKVVELGRKAFEGCKMLTSADMSETQVTEIPESIFSGCSSLKEILMPKNVRLIGKEAFFGTAIKSLVLPSSVDTIAERAYGKCERLESVDLGDTQLAYIADFAFSGCSKLSKFVLPPKLARLGSDVFSECGKLKSIYYYGGDIDSKFTLPDVDVFVTDKFKHQTLGGQKVQKADVKRQTHDEEREVRSGLQQTAEEESHTTRNAVICVVIVVCVCVAVWYKFDPYGINGSEGVELEGELPCWQRAIQKIGFSIDRMASRAPAFNGV